MQKTSEQNSFLKTVFIFGPTAVGKTDFSYQLSAHSKRAIINCDIGQFYKQLSIGTAKPDFLSNTIPHYLFDILDESEVCNIADYRESCDKLIAELATTATLPIFVGGSLFYAESLFFKQPARFELAGIDRLEKEKYSWALLNRIDPLRASRIHHNDTYRIDRALDIWYTTGTLPSDHTLSFDPLTKESTIFFLTREREDLYERINKRTEFMLQNGWIEEVEQLSSGWKKFIKEKKIIGYAEIVDFLHNGSRDSKKLTEIIAQKTRNYAKRQLTYWNKLKSKLLGCNGITIHEINLTLSRIDLYLDLATSLNQNIKNE